MAQSQQKPGKKLPKRTSNKNLQERRARSWARGQERKAKRREEQEARHQANLAKAAEEAVQ